MLHVFSGSYSKLKLTGKVIMVLFEYFTRKHSQQERITQMNTQPVGEARITNANERSVKKVKTKKCKWSTRNTMFLETNYFIFYRDNYYKFKSSFQHKLKKK